MSLLILEDAESAWANLCKSGGIELEGRDEGLDRRIRDHLDPSAATLEEALSVVSLKEFIEAFFHSLHPYVEMFRDILDFFEKGSATKGESQWTLRVDDVDLDLEHFREWLTKWDSIAKSEISVPAIDKNSVWKLFDPFRERKSIQDEIRRPFEDGPLNVEEDVRAWAAAYKNNIYLSLPESLLPPQCPCELQDCASIAHAALQLLQNLRLTPSSLKDLYDNKIAQDPSDGLDFRNISQNETDHWLRTFIVSISSAATLPVTELEKLGEELDSITSQFAKRPLQVDVSMGDLDSVLSLPIWKKRYDLFSVWIAIEIMRSLDNHDVEIHHDNGTIAFSFKETLIATIHSSSGPFRLISERRIPLENPRGKGRRAGVQPDHGLWTVKNGEDVCRMAIEVKHYKRSAKSKFIDVFEDYGRAVADGEVYLVNHGPINESVYDLTRKVQDRCFAIGHLTASNHKARQELAAAVRKCVGDPVLKWPNTSEADGIRRVLLLDVSGSMNSMMRSEAMNSFIRSFAASVRPVRLVAADTEIIGEWEPSETGFTELLRTGGGSTDLLGPISQLLWAYDEVLLITDSDVLPDQNTVAVSLHEADSDSPHGTSVLVCSRC